MSDAASTLVGFVGLGKMGSAMTQHILKAGFPVIGWDRNAEAVARFAGNGGIGAQSLSEIGRASIVVSIVFDDEGTRETVLGPGGLAETLSSGSTHIAMASISPAMSRTIADAHAARGQHYLAASIFGRPEAAAAADLLINCSGAVDTYEAIRPLLALLGRTQWIGTEPEQAMLLKTFGNSMIYVVIETLREMFPFLKAGGISEADAKRFLIDTLFPGQIFAGYAQRYIDDPGSTRMADNALKDRKNCLDAATQLGVDVPLIQFLNDRNLPD